MREKYPISKKRNRTKIISLLLSARNEKSDTSLTSLVLDPRAHYVSIDKQAQTESVLLYLWDVVQQKRKKEKERSHRIDVRQQEIFRFD